MHSEQHFHACVHACDIESSNFGIIVLGLQRMKNHIRKHLDVYLGN